MHKLEPDRHIISFIGTDGVGKDTAANIALEYFNKTGYNVRHFKNADILKSIVCKFHGIDEADYEFFKRSKAKMNGKTLREWMVFFAQTVFKPVLGDDFFSQSTRTKISHYLDFSGTRSVVIKSDDRYGIEFGSNCHFEVNGLMKYILLLKDESEYKLFFEQEFNPDNWANKPYMSDLHNFVNKNKEFIILVYNNGSVEDLCHKLGWVFYNEIIMNGLA
jgi:hypothetical protein